MQTSIRLRTLMKDARGGLHSLVEDALRLLEFNEHSPAQVQPLLINAGASRGGGSGIRSMRRTGVAPRWRGQAWPQASAEGGLGLPAIARQ